MALFFALSAAAFSKEVGEEERLAVTVLINQTPQSIMPADDHRRASDYIKRESRWVLNEQRVKIKIHIEQILKIMVMNGKNSEFANSARGTRIRL